MTKEVAAFGGAKRAFGWRNFIICFVVSLGQMAFGYPASVIGVTLGQPSFLLYMGLITPEGELTPGANGKIGAMSGVFQAGAFVGVMVGQVVMDKWGRKAGIIYCATLSIVSGACLCASQNVAMFVVFRFFAGAGSWGFLALTPVYTAELAPAESRGLFVGLNGILIGLGYACASYAGLGFFYLKNNPQGQWRGPLGLALLFPIIMLCALPFIPESPRYLLMKGRTEDAWKVVSELHATPGDPDSEYARGEFYQMQKQTEMDRTLNPSWAEMFRKPSYRKRCILAIMFAFIGQSTAVLVINNYGPTFYKALGFDTRDQLILQCGWISVSLPGNAIGALLMDRIGRRPLMLFGVGGCCICLILEAAMTAQYADAGTNKAGLGVGVAAFYLFLLVYSLGIDVAGVVFYGELFPNHIRGKGLALSISTIALTDLIYLQVTAQAFATIKWKFFLVFIIISGLGFIYLFFTLPETKGIPLEELGKIFGDDADIVVYADEIEFDKTTHEVVVHSHHHGALAGEKAGIEVAHTEARTPTPTAPTTTAANAGRVKTT